MAVNYEELVNGASAGDAECKRELYNNTVRDVYDIITADFGTGEEADEITKEVYSKVFSRIKKLKRAEDFPLWVKAIAIEAVNIRTEEHRAATEVRDAEAKAAAYNSAGYGVDEPTRVIPTVSAPREDYVDEPTRVLPIVGKKDDTLSQPPERVSSSPVTDFIKSVVALPYFKYAVAGIVLLVVVLAILIPVLFGSGDVTKGLDLPESVVVLVDNTTYSGRDDIKISNSMTMHRSSKNSNMIIEIKNFLHLRNIDSKKVYNVNLYKGESLSVSYPCYYPDTPYVYSDDGLHNEASYVSIFHDGNVTLFLSEHEIKEYGIPDRICITAANTDGTVIEVVPDMDFMYDKDAGRYVPYDSHAFEKEEAENQPPEEEKEIIEEEDDILEGVAFDTTYLDYAGKTYDEICKKFGEGQYDENAMLYKFSSKLGYAFANGDKFGCTAVTTTLDYIISGCPAHLSAEQLNTLIGSGKEDYDEMEDCLIYYFTYRGCPCFIFMDGTSYSPFSAVTYNAIELPENNVDLQKANAEKEAAEYIASASAADGTYTVTVVSHEEAPYGVWVTASVTKPVAVDNANIVTLKIGDTLDLSAFGKGNIMVDVIEQSTVDGNDSTIINGAYVFVKNGTSWVFVDELGEPYTYEGSEQKFLFTDASGITDAYDGSTVSDIRDVPAGGRMKVTVADHRVTTATVNVK